MSKNDSKPSWHGRFTQAPAAATQRFVESLTVDNRLWKHDIAGSIAHATMLRKVGLISQQDLEAIVKGMRSIAEDIEAGKFQWNLADEDIHMAIEAELTRRIGEPGKRLHTARSRNDQVALDLRLWLREAIDEVILPAVKGLQAALVRMAEKQGAAVMPGLYAHAASSADPGGGRTCSVSSRACNAMPAGLRIFASGSTFRRWAAGRWRARRCRSIGRPWRRRSISRVSPPIASMQ